MEYIDSRIICEQLGIARDTLIRWEKLGWIKVSHRFGPGNKKFYSKESYDNLVLELKKYNKIK